MGKESGKMRQPNIELLRIIAMLMIITLHYLDKGGILEEFLLSRGISQRMVWGLETLSMVSVNIYVLISGYFLVGAEFKVKKLILLWAQVLFFSWLIGGIFLGAGLIPAEEKTFYDLIFIFLPVTSGHYWFATVYIGLYCIFPFLNAGINHMDQKQHRSALIVMLVLFSLWNTFLPFTIPLTDHEGMDIPWFVFLYFIAAYIRKYPDSFQAKKIFWLLGYFGACLTAYLLGLLMVLSERLFGKLGGYSENFFAYNSAFILAASVCLFLFFIKWEMKLPNWLAKGIVLFGSCTFGVLLIHEHRFLRYFWPKLFHVSDFKESPLLPLHWIGTILAVFLLCSVIEKIRQLLFGIFTSGKIFKRRTKNE